jgi:hypothetical protein
MKKLIISSTIVLVFGLLTPHTTQAQGIVYLSSLDQTSASSIAVGSNSWLGVAFRTGANAGGYLLNSIQLGMADDSGNPSSFTVMLYSSIPLGDFFPGTDLGTLNGSSTPATSGIYTYTPVSTLALSPQTAYFLVLTAGTAIADGAYNWSVATSGNTQNGGWQSPIGLTRGDNYNSVDGSSWTVANITPPQFAITATAIPEPGILSLFGMGSLVLFGIFYRRCHPRIGSR